jgi:hypothetical protein
MDPAETVERSSVMRVKKKNTIQSGNENYFKE